MFVRLKRSVQNGKTYEYLQLTRSFRSEGKVRQEVLATLGRREELVESGELDSLIRSLSRFSERLEAVEKVRRGGLDVRADRLWGPPLVFERLWQKQGLGELLDSFAKRRRFGFDAERTSFAMALQRLVAPGSDLQGSQWVKSVECDGFGSLELHHFYRTCGFLHDIRQELESALFLRDRSLFDEELDLVFVDTTSLYVHSSRETRWRKHGYSRDRRGDLPQYVLAVAVDRHSWPIAWEILPGNTADTAALAHLVKLFRKRFRLGRVVVVGDRGMFGQKSFDRLLDSKSAPFDFIVGCPMRTHKEVRDDVLARPGRYRPIADNLEVKEVVVGERRYVVCRNPDEARKDAADREAILAKLRETLENHGAKSVVKNRGYARFLKVARGSMTIDEAAIEADARLDGKFVITTSTDLPTDEVALAYKGLWRVERTFRKQKSTLEVRPIYHQSDEHSIGHIVASFLALRLEVDLQRQLDEANRTVSWPTLMRDLANVRSIDVDLDGQRYRLRSDLAGTAHQAFAAAGVRPPPRLTHLGASSTVPRTGEEGVVPNPSRESVSHAESVS